MVSKITCSVSNDVFQSIADKGNVYDFLIIPIEEKICLDSISGWKPYSSPGKIPNEEDSHAMEMEVTPFTKTRKKNSDELSPKPLEMNYVQVDKRKLSSCVTNESNHSLPQKRSRYEKKCKSLNGMDYECLTISDNPGMLPVQRRSISFPDIRQLYTNKENDKISAYDVFLNQSTKWTKNSSIVNDTAVEEDKRLKSLLHSSCPRAEDQISNFGEKDIPAIVIDLCSNQENVQKESKRSSCVRKLDWGECGSAKNHDLRNSSKTPRRNKRMLNKVADQFNLQTPTSQPIISERASGLRSNVSSSLPEVSLRHEAVMISKRTVANNWDRNYSPASSSSIPCAQPVNESNIGKQCDFSLEGPQTNVHVTCGGKDANKEADNDHAACSEELFISDELEGGNQNPKQRRTRANNCEFGTGKKNCGKDTAGMDAVLSKKNAIKSHSLTFTSREVKKMCEVVLRLYSVNDATDVQKG